MKNVLISAPYMIREKAKVSSLLLGKQIRVDWADGRERLEERDLLPIIGKYHGIICGDDRISSRVLDAAVNLEVIVKWGTGIDSIDKLEAEKRNIAVSRTPDAFTEPVADTVLGLMLAFARSIFTSDRLIKAGGWDKPASFCLSEKVVGIIGLGNIGSAVAKRLSAFGAVILANDIVEKDPEFVNRFGIRIVEKEEIYEQADMITLHCDLNPASHHLLNDAVFSRLKKTPCLVNTARGPLIDERALVAALRAGKIAGAGLDVFEHEPLPIDSPLREMDNVILSAHNSNSSPYCWHRVHINSVRMLLEGLGLG